MKIGYSLDMASGPTKNDCYALGFRFESQAGFSPDAGESYVIQNVADKEHTLRGTNGWYTGVWRSESGKAFLAEADYRIYIKPDLDPDAQSWQEFKVPCVLAGIWGLNDNLVFAWGGLGDREYLMRWDGRRWESVDAPSQQILGMHGVAPDLIYAVGPKGYIARWDGSRWNDVPSPTKGTLSSVFVVGENEMYACGNGRRLIEGSIHGWSELLDAPTQLLSVVKWKGEVWVAAPDTGLLKLVGNKLETVKDGFKPTHLDARGNLLCSCPDKLVDSVDGKRFTSVSVQAFKNSVKGDIPLWLSPGDRVEFEEEDA